MARIPRPPRRPVARRGEDEGPNAQFLNPYNFVSAPPRATTGVLGDGEPASHGVVAPASYSARIPIRLTTRTPMLIPDQPRGQKDVNRPKRLATRKDRHGDAILSGSTVKGSIRAAYEAITNSRFGVFDSRHELPGAIRSVANSALELQPAVITEVRYGPDGTPVEADAKRVVSLVPTGAPNNMKPMPAAWLPINLGSAFARRLRREPWRLDSEEVYAWIQLQRHPNPTFYMWRVSALELQAEELADPENVPKAKDSHWNARDSDGFYEPIRVKGVIHWTGGRFGTKKHDERLFVTEILPDDDEYATLQLEDVVLDSTRIREWEATIASYRRAHEDETAEEQRHAGLGNYIQRPDRWELKPGRTLHLRYDNNDALVGVTPAMIGRDVFAYSPSELAPDALKPAKRSSDLSPADRVFGWVADGREKGESAARKGHLRVTAPRVVDRPSGKSIEGAPGGALWLTTLNGPKPSQFRFYITDRDRGILQQQPKNARAAFRRTDRLRGRKFYLPHVDVSGDSAGAQQYWRSQNAGQSVRVNGRHRYPEHVDVARDKPNVGVEVKDWVPVATAFTCELIVDNVSATELGALLWLLALPEQSVFTIGMAKPLGFGATRIDAIWEDVRISSAEQIRERYSSLTAAAQQLSSMNGSGESEAQTLIDKFDKLLHTSTEMQTVRTEFLNATMGYEGLPVHYPRVFGPNNSTAPRARSYEWWVKNEQTAANRYALELMDSAEIPWLPYL
ncbi:MAG: TIGR03986 family CRISPR-associated RAMP protein [Gordonia sp. (in: high G+C Gram-positive bacteria)]